MGLFDYSDNFQHQRGQEDGAHGRLFGTTGDPFCSKYREGFEGGRFDYEKERYGEAYARASKAERDFAHRISEGGSSSSSSRDSYGSGDGGGVSTLDSSDSLVSWGILLFIIVLGLGIGTMADFLTRSEGKDKGPPLVDISSTPPSQRPAIYIPAIRLPNERCLGLYLCTEENYNPKEWRVTLKTISHTFDGGKTWHILVDVRNFKSGTTIHSLKAIDNRVGEERTLRPDKRELYYIIEEL